MRIFEENHPTRTLRLAEHTDVAWAQSPVESKMDFIRLQLAQLEAADVTIRQSALICLSHLVQGTRLGYTTKFRCFWRGR